MQSSVIGLCKNNVFGRTLNKYKQKIDLSDFENYKESIYFIRACLPREGTNDKEISIIQFKKLNENINFQEWENKWKEFNLY